MGTVGAAPVAETTTLVLGGGGFDTLVDTPEPPTMADSREISSREETRAFVRRSFSFSRYSTLAWSWASHAFLRCRHLRAAVKDDEARIWSDHDSKYYLGGCVPRNSSVSLLPSSVPWSDRRRRLWQQPRLTWTCFSWAEVHRSRHPPPPPPVHRYLDLWWPVCLWW